MNTTRTLEQFLVKATGLPSKQVIELFNAGYPWPVWTTYETKRAGILAQAKELLFPMALAQVEAETEAAVNTRFDTIEADTQASDSATVRWGVQTPTSLPWLKEMQTHIEHVAVHTKESPRTVFLFSLAIQRFAIMNPGWELVMAFANRDRLLS